MNLKNQRLFCLLTILVVGSFSFSGCDKQSVARTEKAELKTNEIPPQPNKMKYWEEVFFKSINSKQKKLKLLQLTSKAIEVGNIEIRIWVGFGESASSDIDGLILEKKQGKWAGFYLPKDAKGKMTILSKEPKSGWELLWKNLNAHNFLTISDITESKDNLFNDAACIVVEIKDSRNYRNYMQVEDNGLEDYPELRSPESIKLTEVCRMLSKEFDITLCTYKSVLNAR